MNPKVSIILTSYNKPHLVGKAIHSVLEQTMTDWELFIMDDHSNKETRKVISSFLGDDRIHYFNSYIAQEDRLKTTRYATLINEAIQKTSGKYISYLTDDTIYLPNRLQEMVDYLEGNPTIDIVYSAQLVKIVDDHLNEKAEFTRPANDILQKASNIVDHCSVMHTRKILEKVKEKFGSYWDDDPKYWSKGDAVFWDRLTHFQPFYPIDKVLDITYKTPQSVQTAFQNLPVNLPDGIFVSGTDGNVYFIDEGKRRLVKQEFLPYFLYSPNEVIIIPDPYLYQYEKGLEVNMTNLPNNFFYKDELGNVYFLEKGKKRLIRNRLFFNKYLNQKRKPVSIPKQVLDSIPDHPTLSSLDVLFNGYVYNNYIEYFILHNGSLYPVQQKVLERLQLLQKKVKLSGRIIHKYPRGDPEFFQPLNW